MTAPEKDRDDKFRDWQNRIKDLLDREIHLLNFHQDLFTQVRDDAVERYSDWDFTWVVHYAHLYAHRQAVAIRRLCEQRCDVRSLYALIDSIDRDIEVLSVERFESIAGNDLQPEDIPFTVEPSSNGLIHRQETKQSLDALSDTSRRIKEFVDTMIAHRDPSGDGLVARGHQSVTYEEIRDSIAVVSREAVKWHLFLNGVETIPGPLVPRSWQGILRNGLFQPAL